MVEIKEKYNCCGCSACVQICPKKCIDFCEDNHGFCYPIVNKKQCIECHLCEKVCPYLTQNAPQKPIKVYAGINQNEKKRLNSSSGGIFILLAEKVIEAGGVVFGARFDENWQVRHDYTETREGLAAFQGSKYVQSLIGDSFIQVRNFLELGRTVLFSGTSCQIAGLKRFLRKDFFELITIDIACHGVPSPLIWRTYLKELPAKPANISFRDKRESWKNYKLTIIGTDNKNGSIPHIIKSEYFRENLYMQSFLKDLCLRPSCHNCPTKEGKSNSDIMLSDFWGVEKYHRTIDDDKGISAILVYSEKGMELLKNVNAILIESTFENVVRCNPNIIISTKENKYEIMFWNEFYNKGLESCEHILQMMKPGLCTRVMNKFKYYYNLIVR